MSAGEGIFRGILRPTGRYLMAPQKKRMTPEARELMKEAEEIGARPAVSMITRAPLLGRYQSMIHRIFGDPEAKANAVAINNQIAKLKQGAGPETGGVELGELIAEQISSARRALAKWAEGVSTKIDGMTGGASVVPTASIKSKAKEIWLGLPRGKDRVTTEAIDTGIVDKAGKPIIRQVEKTEPGKIILTEPLLVKSLGEIQSLPKYLTVTEAQRVSQRLFNSIADDTIIPGITARDSRLLWKASTEAFGQVEDVTLRRVLVSFRNKYKTEIRKFDNALVERIMKNPSYASRLEPEQIVSSVFMKGRVSTINRLHEVVDPKTWAKMERAAMDDLLSTIIQRTDDPLVNIFNGKKFLNALDAYGRETLNAMFGRRTTDALYKFGQVTSFVTQKMALSGGIVAASIALHPLINLPILIRFKIISSLLRSPFIMRWLTDGLEATTVRKSTEILTRFAVYVNLQVDQYTRGVISPASE